MVSNKAKLLATACTLTQLSFGYGDAITSVAPAQIQFLISTLNETGTAMALVKANMAVLATIAGAVVALILGKLLNRKYCVVGGSVFGCLGWILMASSQTLGQFAGGRILAGLGFGVITVSAPVWQAESTNTRLRGRLVLLQFAGRAFGNCLAGWVALSYLARPEFALWRLLIAVTLILISCALGILIFVPKSLRNHDDQAMGSLEQQQRSNSTPPPYQCRAEQPAHVYEARTPVGSKKLRRTVLSVILVVVYAISTSSSITSWLSLFLQSYGYSALIVYMLAMCESTCLTACCVLSIVLVERIGRRKTLGISFLGLSVCLVPVTIILTIPSSNIPGATVALLFGFLVAGFYGLNYGTVWLWVVEINASSFRLPGVAVATIVYYSITFSMSFASVLLRSHTAWPVVFLVSNILLGTITYFLVPETSGRSLQAIDRQFKQGLPLVINNYKTATSIRWVE
ncbi:hypothetical protein LTR37_000027 [Vermiconidia calcicola]|uniref:Uncharacterized protein n=1 Tax=Vermiconidia calcicola TaxID=1690605 RepID=A0ACC3NZ80_9PEZI|nr:hypothetical protein LTR37_000027 [Vermiconidia calcicola]